MKMTNIKKAALKIQKAIGELEKAIIEKDMKILSVSSLIQLLKFKETFMIVLYLIKKDKIPPENERNLGIAKIIADQWPFDLELGSIIIDAEKAYRDI